MKVVRTVREEDVDSLLRLTKLVGEGMTTLKPDRKMLSKRIAVACESFAETNQLEERDYLFVMEETDSKEVVGVCAVRSRVGLDEPFYNFRVGTLVHSSKELKVYKQFNTLSLSNDLTGCSEVCSLFLHPDHRTRVNGKLLSKSRFLFITQFSHLFSEKIIAEMRGYQRPDGTAPFWDSLGRHFFQMEFNRADNLSIVGKKAFIAELMPRYPLYVNYLSDEAQEAIGKVHPDTVPARHMLEGEGFSYQGYIDIFDGGPTLEARAGDLRSAHESTLAKVIDATETDRVGEFMLVANTTMRDYRTIVSDTSLKKSQCPLTDEQQHILRIPSSEQAKVRVMTLSAKKGGHE
jgi:arginine N-succinyltransferase